MNTILIIDDNDDYRDLLREILEFENFATLEAENGMVGLQMIHQHLPSVILCDIDMPDMNGLEVLKAVKSNPTYAKIPFIFATGNRDKRTIQAAQTLGAEKYLTKPVNITEFLATIVHFSEQNVPALAQ